MITLNDFEQKFFSTGSDFAVAYVFDNESVWDAFCNGARNVDILFTLCSCLKPRAYLSEKYYNAPVYGFVAVEKGVIAVLIDTEGKYDC